MVLWHFIKDVLQYFRADDGVLVALVDDAVFNIGKKLVVLGHDVDPVFVVFCCTLNVEPVADSGTKVDDGIVVTFLTAVAMVVDVESVWDVLFDVVTPDVLLGRIELGALPGRIELDVLLCMVALDLVLPMVMLDVLL